MPTPAFPHRYAYFDASVASDLPLPELPPLPDDLPQDAPDVTITQGAVPPELTDAAYRGVCLQLRGETFIWTVDGVARYGYDASTGHLTVDAAAGADPASVRLFLQGPVWGTLAFLRGELPILGSSVALGDAGLLFLGEPGIGKSTAAAFLTHHGARLLADGLCLVRTVPGGAPDLLPGAPLLKLWPATLDALGRGPDDSAPLRPGVEKRGLLLPDTFQGTPVPIRRIYFVQYNLGGEGFEVERVTGQPALYLLMRSMYQSDLSRLAGREHGLVAHVAALAKHAEVSVLRRPHRRYIVESDVEQLVEAVRA